MASRWAWTDRLVIVSVKGAGVLQCLGSARPKTQERFDAATHTTFDGCALAIVPPIAEGAIDVTVSAEGCEDVTITVEAHAVTPEAEDAIN